MTQDLGVLGRIVARTRERLVVRRRELPLHRVVSSAPTPVGRRGFAAALARPDHVNVIAEFKRRSPSRGVIREDLHPVRVAQGYEIAGAAALSVLTEEQFFGGNLDDLQEARAATLLPTLRKDFIVDPYQVWEARMSGADALLLIVAALSDGELRELMAVAEEAGLEALVEVHDQDELRRALTAGARLVGVNNRDLTSLRVRLDTSFELVRSIPDDVVAVAESGIRNGQDVRRLREAGFDAFLIGEHFMQAPNPGSALEELLAEAGGGFVAAPEAIGTVQAKICGITSVDDGLVAARAGADAVGFVFWSGSPRYVEPETARRIGAALPPFVTRVGVFVDAPRLEIERTTALAGLDLLQLHGQESPDDLRGLPRRALKALRVGPGFEVGEALRYAGVAAGILVDTRAGASPGGTGQTFDWSLVRDLRNRVPFLVLAGGLDAENVRSAVAAVRPDAVDVSSGVESSPGRKDPEKVRAFLAAVKGARG